MLEMMKKIPIDVSSFKILRTKDYIYVDKTKQIYDLITGGRFYFLSRPRRFGKSLFISTLKEIFLGNRKLFDGLWIDHQSSYDWQSYPVIHLDFSLLPITSGIHLEESLSWALNEIAKQHGFDVSSAPNPGLKLKSLIQNLSEKNLVVMLIDEYDFPLINNITNPTIAKENHAVLHAFYSALKGLDEFLQAIFVTGVTKYAKTLFSGLNNLNDLSSDPRAATLLGYRKEEIQTYFPDHIKKLEVIEKMSDENALNWLEERCNSYRFSEESQYVYNPISVFCCLSRK